ncbi:MAG: class I SAM-dependent methyltransferase, partial [Thiolinea sp.]
LKVRTLQRDLENTPDPFADFPDGSFDLICVARYLHRPLFPVIRRLLASGGVLLYQTFMQGCEQTAVGRPRNPDFLLRPGELAAEFADAEIILDQIETLDDGRPVAAFVARKR